MVFNMKMRESDPYGERGAAELIEAAIVLPLCFLTVLFVFAFGFCLNQQALLDAAAERGLLLAQRLYTDPNADALLDLETGRGFDATGYGAAASLKDVDVQCDPYRYWSKYQTEEIGQLVEEQVKAIVETGQIPFIRRFLGEPQVNYENEGGLVAKRVSVQVEQRFTLFPALERLLPDTKPQLRAEAHLRVLSQTEFIRNADFIYDLLERFNLTAVMDKMKSMFDKILTFFQD